MFNLTLGSHKGYIIDSSNKKASMQKVSPELAEQIKKRIKEANDNKIAEKALAVAKYLGNNFGDRENFKKDRLSISVYSIPREEAIGLVTIYTYHVEFDGKCVFCKTDTEITIFIPGEWELLLNELYELAKAKIPEIEERRRIHAREAQELIDKQERANWGL